MLWFYNGAVAFGEHSSPSTAPSRWSPGPWPALPAGQSGVSHVAAMDWPLGLSHPEVPFPGPWSRGCPSAGAPGGGGPGWVRVSSSPALCWGDILGLLDGEARTQPLRLLYFMSRWCWHISQARPCLRGPAGMCLGPGTGRDGGARGCGTPRGAAECLSFQEISEQTVSPPRLQCLPLFGF